MHKKITLTLVSIFIQISTITAQQTLNISGKTKPIAGLSNLNIGDSLPDFSIPKIINTPKSTAKTSEFKEQLLIIDFWSIYCSGCIEALPKMNALQKLFGNKIKILPVTYESEALVSEFWKKNRNTKGLGLPSVVEDQIFASYFRHQTIPHEVWIYKGKVIAITTSQYVDEPNIRKVLNGESIKWPPKNDFYQFDGNKESLFKLQDAASKANATHLKYAITGAYKEGVNSEGLSGGVGIVRDSIHKTVRTFFLNQDIYTAYLLNWAKKINPYQLVKPSFSNIPNQVVWEVEDKSRYFYDPKTSYLAEWIRGNGICFESLNPDTGQTDKEIASTTITDMNLLLGLNVRWEKRKEKVLLLILKRGGEKLKSSNNIKNKEDHLVNKNGIQYFRSLPLSTLTYKLNQQKENPYVFDETNYNEAVDLDLKIPSWTDIPAIRKALAKYGLDLIEEERMVDKFVFTTTK
ncbi:TlpA family protein disulfide reductase [Pedobacter caeni]|uniref:Thiol-disulfide isomerase or thioredoxin n=1 Tax=Pedobacter caeni TaxID=288992 RepID=A0A1M5H497_9SPHI|nr:redoxin family protein [Pedobacter caeni]SHG10713.1 Thiol-disulfide isomerase or thioredoxin [Pedobacter caeni]